MDINVRTRELFYNNLLILGFNKAAVEKDYRIVCDMNMFCLPNLKMFEIVTHFLFSKLNEVSRQKYNICWPLLGQDHRKQFQKSCLAYFKEISQKSSIEFPLIVPSLFSTFSGDRFYKLYFAFSTYVVKKVIEKNNNVSLLYEPVMSQKNIGAFSEVLKLETISSAEKFKEVLTFSQMNLKMLLKTSNEFCELIKRLEIDNVRNNSQYEQKKEAFISLFESDNSESPTLESGMKWVYQFMHKVKKDWRTLQNFLSKEKEFWNSLSTVVENEAPAEILDGAELKFPISNKVKNLCLEVNKNASFDIDEKTVDLLKFMEAFKLFLQFYVEQLAAVDCADFQVLLSAEKSSGFSENISNFKFYNVKLKKTVCDSKENLAKLKKNICFTDASTDLKSFTQVCPSWKFCSVYYPKNLLEERNYAWVPVLHDSSFKSSLLNIFPEGYQFRFNQLGEPIAAAPQSNAPIKSFISSPIKRNTGPTMSISKNNFNESNTRNHFILEDSDLKASKRTANNTLHSFDLYSHSLFHSSPPQDKSRLCTTSTLEPMKILNSKSDYREESFNLNETWYLDESLDAMTLPETSFID